MSSEIVFTPLIGGQEDGGVCGLLEVGGCRILIDCGCTINSSNESLLEVATKLEEGGGVDCVLLSHADVHHVGALAVIFGSQGLAPVPVICTLPVEKFSAMVLYDMQLNIKMEGTPAEGAESMRNFPQFTLDDVDSCLSKVESVKYNQTVPVSHRLNEQNSEQKQQHPITVCAYNSGRTIGGAIWRIKYGATDILYMMDINLKKEVVLDGASLESLPLSPSMLILEGGCASRKDNKNRRERLKEKGGEEVYGIITEINETLRSRGNVLIPCESCARVLELVQVLSKYWVDNKKGLDHLIFLSPMSHNIMELAKSQLEWMTDSLSTKFYNGKPNPFILPPLKIVSSVRDVEKLYPGPKIVFATDASLSTGMGKDLFLRWGGNPHCRVIFVDNSDDGTLSAEIMQKIHSPPVVATVAKPQRVELAGEELTVFRREQENKRRIKEVLAQQKLREEELALLTGRSNNNFNDNENENENETDIEFQDSNEGEGMDIEKSATNDESLKRHSLGQEQVMKEKTKRVKTQKQAAKIAKFAAPLFPMFETNEKAWVTDEYGVSLSDLNIRKEDPSSAVNMGNFTSNLKTLQSIQNSDPLVSSSEEFEDMPFKIVSHDAKVQFTCDFKIVLMNSRADIRAIKTVVSKLTPARVVVLRGKTNDCEAVINAITNSSQNVDVSAPENNQSISFEVRTDRVNLMIPSMLLPTSMKEIKASASVDEGSSMNNSLMLSTIKGQAVETASSGLEGVRKVKLTKTVAVDEPETSTDYVEEGLENEEDIPNEFGFRATEKEDPDADIAIQNDNGITLSVGEVGLNSLKSAIIDAGIKVESITTTSKDGEVSTILVCDKQVIIRKENDNDFMIEGPPVPAYWKTRTILYSHFAFLSYN